MKKFKVMTIGGVLQDITFHTDKGKVIYTPENLTSQKLLAFEYGAKIETKDAHLNIGGGLANVSVSLSKLGIDVTAISRVGEDEAGKDIINTLSKEKVDVKHFQIDKQSHTGFSFILATEKKEKEHVAFSYRGANENFQFQPNNYKVNPDWIYLSSLSGKNWQANATKIFKHATSQKVNIAWNPGLKQLQAGKRVIGEYLKKTTALFLNKDEAIELVLSGMRLGRKNPNHLNRPVYLLNILHDWGPKLVVITCGDKGAFAYDGEKIYKQSAAKVKVMDTTGVGDAFASAFLAGYLYENGDTAKALRWGAYNSESVIKEIGSQRGLLSFKQIQEKINKFKK
jgi:sugar/nucleoside kinase (ribokinase family)